MVTCRIRSVFLFVLFVTINYDWCAMCESSPGPDWSLYQKLQTIQIGLMQFNDLKKIEYPALYSSVDNDVFINDQTKVKRTYNSEQCIKDLETIQRATLDEESSWAFESEQFSNCLSHIK